MVEKSSEEIFDSLTMVNQNKKNEWRRKGWTIPDLRGGKNNWFVLVKNLIILVSENKANNLDSVPIMSEISLMWSWRTYTSFLKGLGLVSNQAGTLHLLDEGIKFLKNPTQRQLADIIHDRIRLFGEVLNLIALNPITVEEADEIMCREYKLNWNNLSHIRKRMDWLEALGMIQGIGNRKWEVTFEGRAALKDWELISQDDIETIEFEILQKKLLYFFSV